MAKKSVVLGDPTTHGGRVISASGTYMIHGKRGVLIGDLVKCPKRGHGVSPILGSRSSSSNGRAMAADGDLCGCGARVIGSGSMKIR